MPVLKVNIPDDLFDKMKLLAGNEEPFVIGAIKEKFNRDKSKNLKDLLKEGYQVTAAEDRMITNELEAADFENV